MAHDYAAELAKLAHEAAQTDGSALKRGEVAALALLGSEEIIRLRKIMNEAHGLIDQHMGDTDPQDPDHPLLRAAQMLSEFLP